MTKTLMALVLMTSAATAQEPAPRAVQDPPPPPRRVENGPQPLPPAPPRQDRRDPFEGPRVVPQPPPPPMPGRPVQPPPELEAVRRWINENEPQTARLLADLQAANRQADAQRVLAEAAPRMRDLESLRQRDPKGFERIQEMHRLERESQELADAVRRAPPEEREARSKKLKESLDKLFDVREEMRVRELAELKRRVEALEKAVVDRKSAKDRIVERRRRELLGEKSEDDW